MMLLLVIIVQVMIVAASSDAGTQHEVNADQWMASCNCENDTALLKGFSAFSRELINNYNNKEQQWKSEHTELLSQATECKVSLQNHVQAAAEWRKKLEDQFIKYEALLEELQISIIDKTSYESITAICKAIHNAKCVGVRCYDVKLALDMNKAQNYQTALAMYDDLITKLTPCLKNPSIQQLIDQKAGVHRKLKELEVPFARAVRLGDIQEIRNLIASGVSIIATDESSSSSSALISASAMNNKDVVRLLIEMGAYLDTQNIFDETALIMASYNNYTEICNMLLTAGANPNLQNWNGETALNYAVFNHNLELFKLLIEKGADVNIATKQDNTPLHTAAQYGHVDIAQLLVDRGAKLDVKNNEGKSPLGQALFSNQTEMVTYLTSVGAIE